MVKCTKEWTPLQREILEGARKIIQSGELGFVCNAVESAALTISDERKLLSTPAMLDIKSYISRLLGVRTHLASWQYHSGKSVTVNAYDHQNSLLIRARWIDWMLGASEADGSEFPVTEEF